MQDHKYVKEKNKKLHQIEHLSFYVACSTNYLVKDMLNLPVIRQQLILQRPDKLKKNALSTL